MAAIIRVKRRLDEDPAENLIIQYKRSRIDGKKTEEPAELCLNLVTTVKSKDATLSPPLQKTLRRHQRQTSYKSRESKRLSQARTENSTRHKSNRYRIVNSRRDIDTSSGDLNESVGESTSQKEGKSVASAAQAVSGLDGVAGSKSKGQTSSESSPESSGASCSEAEEPVIHDVELDIDSSRETLPDTSSSSGHGITLNGQPLVSSPTAPRAESGYVYDLYYASAGTKNYSFRDIENILSIEACHDSLLCESDRCKNHDDEEVYDDEDDSNDEENWRNDYPDKDPDAYSDEECADDFLEGEEFHSYRSSLKDDILAEAMGTRLRIFGSDASSSSSDEDKSDEEDAYADDEGSRLQPVSYEHFIRHLKEVEGIAVDELSSD